jgi:hypothetical protein
LAQLSLKNLKIANALSSIIFGSNIGSSSAPELPEVLSVPLKGISEVFNQGMSFV